MSFEANVGEGFSTGQAIDALTEVVEEVASNTFRIEWAEMSRQEKLAQSSAAIDAAALRRRARRSSAE